MLKERTGEVHSSLTVIRRVANDLAGNARWECLCACGKTTVVRGFALAKTKSCGCAPKTALIRDHTGVRNGRVTVISYSGSDRHGNSIWNCLCDCGKKMLVRGFAIQKTTSCGCANHGNPTHSMHKSPEYKAWQAMKERCNNPSNRRYPRYGGRGITYDPSWEAFEQFYADIGVRPSPKHSIERIDNNLGYSKNNCLWALREVQDNNTSRCIRVSAFGETKTIAQWAKQYGIHHETLRSRLVRYGWCAERAITTPTQ